MPVRVCDPMTRMEHQRVNAMLQELRRYLALLSSLTLSGRTNAPVVDASLEIERLLQRLCLRLDETAQDGHGVAIYGIDLPARIAATDSGSPLTATEHMTLGAEVGRLKQQMLKPLGIVLHRYEGVLWAPLAARQLLQAVDTLRRHLNELFYDQLPQAYTPQAYFAGFVHINPIAHPFPQNQ